VPANWLRVRVRNPSPELVDRLAEGFFACGASALEEQPGELITYLPLDAETAIVSRRLRSALREALGEEPPELDLEHVPEQDWLALWRSGLGPRRVGAHLVVAPTWSDVEPEADDVLIRIDPQMAFGTGEHASTRGVLRLLQQAAMPGARLLDVGTGSAILAIAGALLGAASVIAVESDPDALPNAAENVAGNGVANRIELVCAHVDDSFLGAYGGGAFDGILANVLSSVLIPLLPAFHAALAADGWAILAGILTEEAAAVRTAAAAAGFAVTAQDVEAEWWGVLLRRIGS
jgi:ribosomal protein L11 methyltransferase